jgi:uncharacterized repeat protein (TIGR01451 family)
MKVIFFLRAFRFLFLLILLGVQLDSFGQDVKLETQAQVNAFNPETTVVNGNLQIGTLLMPSSGFGSDITDISNLSNLTTIEGYLHVIDVGLLGSLDALKNITSIDDHLEIRENYSLTNVDGLNGITEVGGDLKIKDNFNLLNLDGLSKITTINRSLFIEENENLIDITGLSGITSFGSGAKSIHIRFNDNLVNLDGLNNITEIGWLRIYQNDNLLDINGLSSITSADGIQIFGNDRLLNLDGLVHVNYVDDFIRIERNHELMNIDGLSGVTTVNGYLLLERNDKITNLDGLSGINSIKTDLRIISNKDLTNLDGLIGLTELIGELNVVSNENLTNLDGLASLIGVVENLSISSNDNLTNLDGLSGISKVKVDIEIISNKNLKNCCGIHDLLEDFEPTNDGTITIAGNPSECNSEQEILGSFCNLTIITDTSPPCIGAENGVIQVNIKGYDAIPFYYTWLRQEDNMTGNGISLSDQFTIPLLGTGTYNLTVTNSEPDTAIKTDIVLSQKEGYIFEIAQLKTTNSSNGQNNGSITINTSGGISPYKYSWSGANLGNDSGIIDNTYTIPSLSYGEYTIIIEDNVGASKIVEVTVLDENVPVITCKKPLDIVILNDVSASVDAIEYFESKRFFVDFIKEVNIGYGEEESRAAIIEWSSANFQRLKIPFTGTSSNLESYLSGIRAFNGGTSPHEAMKFGASYLDTIGRNGVEKVMILSTDGTEGQISSSLVALADEYKAKGYHIITIAFDGAFSFAATRELLRRVASIDALAPGAPAYSELDADLAKNIVSNYLCPIDPGSSSTAYFNRDGAIDIISIDLQDNCPSPDFVDVTINVSALRELSLPAGTPITFYHNNPNQFGSTQILTWRIPCAIPIGFIETFTVTLPMDTPSHIFAVLNDDGIKGSPISFPITIIEELAYSNNIDRERICLDNEATLQALKYSTLPIPACDTLVNYTINVCNISEIDAFGVTVTDIAPVGFVLIGSIFNDNGCSSDMNGAYDIPADCCLTLSLTYDAASADYDYFGDQGVDLDGPSNQRYIDFDGSKTTDEDVTINGNIDCPSTNITFTTATNIDESCDDGFVEFTFTITNKMNIPIQGLVFTDVLPYPCTWVFSPYGENGLSIANSDIIGNEAIFTIDEVQANTVATFHLDASLNSWGSDGSLSNTATLENVPDVINGGYTTLTSNTTSIVITASPQIIIPDTIVVNNLTDTVNLNAVLSTFADVIWTTDGDGIFIDNTSESTMYIFGTQDNLNGQVSIFISAISECNETGKSVTILIEEPNGIKVIPDFNLVKIYPNPFKNTILIESIEDLHSYEIMDLNGKSVAEKRIIISSSNIEIDMSSYPSGVYLLKLISKNGIQYAKAMKN